MLLEIALRHDGRIQQHGLPAVLFGQPRRVIAAERAADDGHVARTGHLCFRDGDRFERRHRQRRAPPLVNPAEFGHARGELARLLRFRRRPEAVQVQDHVRLPSASSSFWCTPPKPPLLITSTWSPGRAAATTDFTSRCRSSNACALSPSGASASVRFQPSASRPVGAPSEHEIGVSQARRQLRLHHAELHRVRARLEHREDAGIVTADAGTKAGDRGVDRGRMVREIVVDGHAVHAAAHFHPALHVAE